MMEHEVRTLLAAVRAPRARASNSSCASGREGRRAPAHEERLPAGVRQQAGPQGRAVERRDFGRAGADVAAENHPMAHPAVLCPHRRRVPWGALREAGPALCRHGLTLCVGVCVPFGPTPQAARGPGLGRAAGAPIQISHSCWLPAPPSVQHGCRPSFFQPPMYMTWRAHRGHAREHPHPGQWGAPHRQHPRPALLWAWPPGGCAPRVRAIAHDVIHNRRSRKARCGERRARGRRPREDGGGRGRGWRRHRGSQARRGRRRRRPRQRRRHGRPARTASSSGERRSRRRSSAGRCAGMRTGGGGRAASRRRCARRQRRTSSAPWPWAPPP